ncbi:MAG: hypothetical protein BACD_00175 [Bacteroides rodentium]
MELAPLEEAIRNAVYEGVCAALKDSGVTGEKIKAAQQIAAGLETKADKGMPKDKAVDNSDVDSEDTAAVSQPKESEGEADLTAEASKKADDVKPAKAADKAKTKPVEQTKITHDDLVRIAAAKVKAKKENTDKIGSLIQTYGISNLKDLPEEKFEQFLTDLNEI